LARKNSNARPDDLAAAVEEAEALDGRDLLTGAPAPGATTDAYIKWLQANGMGGIGYQPTPRERMQDLYRAAARRRATAKHGPTEKTREKALANADYFEAQADAIRQTLPEFQPWLADRPIINGPSCPYCDIEFPDANSLWNHRLSSCPHP
jgi:hypothetical protein